MAVTPENLHEWMHPALFKAINEMASERRSAFDIFMKTSKEDLREMLDLAAIYIGQGQFELNKNGKVDYGSDAFYLDHCYDD